MVAMIRNFFGRELEKNEGKIKIVLPIIPTVNSLPIWTLK